MKKNEKKVKTKSEIKSRAKVKLKKITWYTILKTSYKTKY